MRKALIGLVLVAAVSCGGPSQASATPPATPAGAATVEVAAVPAFGQILVDGGGRTLYLFAADKGTSSTCYGDCATYWPPLLTNGPPVASHDADAALVGTTKRTDGSVQVTYGGHPLYYVITDHNPGDATGQRVNNFGAPWYVVAPDGKQIG